MRSEATGAFRAAFTVVHVLYTNDGTAARRAVACTIAPAPDRNHREPT